MKQTNEEKELNQEIEIIEERQVSKRKKPNKKIIVIASIILAVILILVLVILLSKKSEPIAEPVFETVEVTTVETEIEEPEIITEANLEKIINVSELSTFEAVYNGIATVMNEENPEEVDYYVSYDSRVKAGIDFEKVEIKVDNEEKIVNVEIPEIKINDINVDITSLDYIFENDKSNSETVSEQAYKKCIEDVETASNDENAIYELAEQNAKNIIEALIKPFINQIDSEYKLIID